jgi:hypothetical protein
MVQIENHCVGCAVPSYPCMGESCPRRNVEVHYCDRCNEEIEEVFLVDGEELCEECLKNEFRKEY